MCHFPAKNVTGKVRFLVRLQLFDAIFYKSNPYNSSSKGESCTAFCFNPGFRGNLGIRVILGFHAIRSFQAKFSFHGILSFHGHLGFSLILGLLLISLLIILLFHHAIKTHALYHRLEMNYCCLESRLHFVISSH